MELIVNVTEQTARKMQKLSKVGNLSGAELEALIAEAVEARIKSELLDHAGKILEEAGLSLEDVLGHYTSPKPKLTRTLTLERSLREEEILPKGMSEIREMVERGQPYPFFKKSEEIEEDEKEEDIEEIDDAHDLAGDDADFDKYDAELPDLEEEESRASLILPGDDEDEEETQMPIKDKTGNITKSKYSFMDDIQEEAESMDGDDVGEEFTARAKPRGANILQVGRDTPISDDGRESIPDILPVDYNLAEVSESDEAATDFFMRVVKGVSGNKENRNRVTKKRR